ncbi:MAG: acyltransferase family protein [Actinomycetota bacterium]
MTADGAFRRDIQGLRGLAVVLVVLYHGGFFFDSGYIGVDVFFVISGFVITSMLMRIRSQNGKISLGEFYSRRVKRILPAAAFTTLVVAVAAVALQSPNGAQQSTAKVGIGSAAMLANVVIPREAGSYFAPAVDLQPFLHMWSLGVEEQFYVLFPVLLVLVGLGGLSPDRWKRRAAVALALVSVASMALCFGWACGYLPGIVSISARDAAFYLMPARAWEVAVGGLVALWASSGGTGAPWLRASGLCAVVATAWMIPASVTFPGLVTVIPVLATAAILLPASARQSRLTTWTNRALENRVIFWLGDRSYAWYLWHWPVIVFTRIVDPGASRLVVAVAALSSLGPAAFSYRFVENPIRHSHRLRGWLVAGLAASAILLPASAAFGLGIGASRGWGQEWALGAHTVKRSDCDAGDLDPERCTWNRSGTDGDIVLVGDSQAWALGNAAIAVAEETNMRLTALVLNGCPFLDPEVTAGRLSGSACETRSSAVLDYLQNLPAGVVIVANNSPGYIGTRSELRDVWSDALSSAIDRIESFGHSVVVALPPPVADVDAGTASLLLRPHRPRSTDATTVLANREPSVAADRSGAEANVVFDPADVLCDSEKCVTATKEGELYTDRNHLSVIGARQLDIALGDAVRTAKRD